MKTAFSPLNLSKTASLNGQIRHAEQQLLRRQRQLAKASAKLGSTIHRLMTKPTSLLLASGTGFIIGELTKSQAPLNRDAATGAAEVAATSTPLMALLSLTASVHTLCTALPLAWMIKSFYQHAPSSTHPTSDG
ncbi:hypothetical protein [Methylomonas rhizoryzae]|uniref:hypothetical protein n=1 Tax=Methylomonas rhizoryzae TaxID=2608981 RepID=UPI001232E31C|nr:hypothetical protein [Methylomonas rhizoryzae]